MPPRPGWDPALAAAVYPGLPDPLREAIGAAVGAGPGAAHAAELPRVLNVRPDPPDFRDQPYEPGFLPLQDQCIPEPDRLPRPRDQGDLGSCTGQALAAVVDVLHARAAGAARPLVSARMLYEMARHYDEMRIDGLDGSSLRGALKGLFHNGVCHDSVAGAQYDPGDPRPFELTVEMARAARGIGLGSYRRLRHVADHWHAALAETGAILASAVIHEGWGRGAVRQAGGRIPLAENPSPQGAHAFAVVGWTPEGFLVLNSEGPGWGGFRPGEGAAPLPGVAVWRYDDWARHVLDGWVLRLAARAPDAFRLVGGYVAASPHALRSTTPRIEINGHYVNLERGRLIEQGPYPSPAPSLQRTADWLASPERAGSHPHLLLHFEDALDSRPEMAARAAWLVPLLKARGIYPIVVFWAEGFAEAVTSLLGGMAPAVQKQAGGVAAVADLMLEAEARRYLRPLWLDLRAQAKAMADPGRHAHEALAVLLALLRRRAEAGRPMSLNLSAHGAGALALGAMAGQVADAGLAVRSLHLLSPLCCDVEATALAAALRPGLGAMLLGPPLEAARAERCGPYGGPLAQLLERSLEPEEGRGPRQAIAALEAAVPGHAVLREGPGGQPLARGHAAMAESGAAWGLVAWRIAGAAPAAGAAAMA